MAVEASGSEGTPMAGYLKSGGRLIPWASLGAAPREDLLAWAWYGRRTRRCRS
jgi:hypothetical protein